MGSFALVGAITPGPVNVLALRHGSHGPRRQALLYVLGASLSYGAIVALMGLFATQMALLLPRLAGSAQWVCAAYLLWLAWKIATSKGMATSGGSGKPQTFLQAAAFQWVNPKAWAMALGAVTAYAPREHYVANIVAVSLIFVAINLPCVMSWTGFGVGLRRFLDKPAVLRGFNIVMALLLVASLIPLALELLQS